MNNHLYIIRGVCEYLDKKFVMGVISSVCRTWKYYVDSEYILKNDDILPYYKKILCSMNGNKEIIDVFMKRLLFGRNICTCKLVPYGYCGNDECNMVKCDECYGIFSKEDGKFMICGVCNERTSCESCIKNDDLECGKIAECDDCHYHYYLCGRCIRNDLVEPLMYDLYDAGYKCNDCYKPVCKECKDIKVCSECSQKICSHNCIECDNCYEIICHKHLNPKKQKCKSCRGIFCEDCTTYTRCRKTDKYRRFCLNCIKK